MTTEGEKNTPNYLAVVFNEAEKMRGGADDVLFDFLSAYKKNPNIQELREHVQKVKEDLAAKIHVYGCIDKNMFLMPRIQKHVPAYEKLLESCQANYKSNTPFTVADIGCCFGTDTRKLILDGVHPDDIYSIDVTDGYWEFGKELFGDKDTLKVNNLFTDVSSPTFGEENSILKNKFNFIYTGAVLHVFAKDEAERFVKNIYDMLASGGTYFGHASTAPEPVQTTEPTPKKDKFRYLHSTASIEELFKSIGFINVETVTVDRSDRQSVIPAAKTFTGYVATKP